MGFENMLIARGIKEIIEWVEGLESPLLKGILLIVLVFLTAWFIIYFLAWQGFHGHLIRSMIIIGIWIFLELAYFVGGGHS